MLNVPRGWSSWPVSKGPASRGGVFASVTRAAATTAQYCARDSKVAPMSTVIVPASRWFRVDKELAQIGLEHHYIRARASKPETAPISLMPSNIPKARLSPISEISVIHAAIIQHHLESGGQKPA